MLSLTTPSQYHQRAEKYLLTGNYIQAASLYEEAITIEPDIKSYYWYLGLILLLQGQSRSSNNLAHGDDGRRSRTS